ncbi:MAG: B12-binding domain-containing radical SAM protein [Steroidobacteraceae bacterium]
MTKRVLILDLNNFARYPSIAVGYLTSILRAGGYDVELLAPLSVGLKGVPRESRPPWWGWLDLEFRYRTGVSRNRLLRQVRARYAAYRSSQLARSKESIVEDFSRRLDDGFDAVLVSTYLMYHPHCVAIGDVCRARGVPMLLGGPYFAAPDVARAWFEIPGVAALVGGEVEPHLCELVRRVIAGEAVDDIPGVWSCQTGRLSLNAPPLADLDSLPFPDYSQFPWSKYPNTIVPMITGRGCGWGACTFCSDITSTAGRTFRSRSPENVLAEIAHQNQRHNAQLFVFTDLKLNSDLSMWRGLSQDFQSRAPGARWVGAVHVGTHGENGLTAGELRQARAAGMVRLTTGFESGSQRVLDKMAKGVDLGQTSRFLENAHAAGISVRMTMFTGFPGEEAADLDETTAFLAKHEHFIERVPIYRFQVMSGTRFAQLLERNTGNKYSSLVDIVPNHRMALIEHHYTQSADTAYRKAISRLLKVVHHINRKPLRESARDFEGVM